MYNSLADAGIEMHGGFDAIDCSTGFVGGQDQDQGTRGARTRDKREGHKADCYLRQGVTVEVL